MGNSYMDWRSHENIRSVELKSKEQFFSDLINIEHMFTNRDCSISIYHGIIRSTRTNLKNLSSIRLKNISSGV